MRRVRSKVNRCLYWGSRGVHNSIILMLDSIKESATKTFFTKSIRCPWIKTTTCWSLINCAKQLRKSLGYHEKWVVSPSKRGDWWLKRLRRTPALSTCCNVNNLLPCQAPFAYQFDFKYIWLNENQIRNRISEFLLAPHLPTLSCAAVSSL